MSEATLFALQHPIECRPAGTGPTATLMGLERRSLDLWWRGLT